MLPVSFDGCCGWLHPGVKDYGVVLCSPEGHEQLCAHNVWINFAEEIAGASFPTLRFDYACTGDSIGDDESLGRIRGWTDSVIAAVRWMRNEIGVKAVALVGLRLGATLALTAAKELGDVDALVLIAPVLSWKSYLRELRARMKFERDRAEAFNWWRPSQDRKAWSGKPEAGGEEILGFVYPEEIKTEFDKLEIVNVSARPAPRILILKLGLKIEDRLAAKFRQLGAEVFETVFSGFANLLSSPFLAEYPRADFDAVVQWLEPSPAPQGKARLPSFNDVKVRLPASIEEPIFFGENASAFGIVNRPNRMRPGAPVLLFLPTWKVSHVGTGRMWVAMSRYFAQLGLLSLRFDLPGIKDSPPSNAYRSEDEFIKHTVAPSVDEAMRAIDWLQSDGHKDVVIVGQCWGALLAKAVSLRDKRVKAQILINLPFLTFDTEMTVQRYIGMVLSPQIWLHFLRGEIAFSSIINRFGEAPSMLKSYLQSKAKGSGFGAREVNELMKLKIPTLLAYGGAESGLYVCQQSDRIKKNENIQVEAFERADHVFYQRLERVQLRTRIEKFLMLHFKELEATLKGSTLLSVERA